MTYHDFLVEVSKYVKNSKLFDAMMKQIFNSDDVLRDVKTGSVPKEGTFEFMNISVGFYFHGIGCQVNIENIIHDFDYGPNRSTNFFDVYKIAKSLNWSSEVTKHIEEEYISRAIDEGYLAYCTELPSNHMYKLVHIL